MHRYNMRVEVIYKGKPGIPRIIEVKRKQRFNVSYRTQADDVKIELDRIFKPRPNYNNHKD